MEWLERSLYLLMLVCLLLEFVKRLVVGKPVGVDHVPKPLTRANIQLRNITKKTIGMEEFMFLYQAFVFSLPQDNLIIDIKEQS